MRDFALRDLLVLAFCLVMIALGAYVFFARSFASQESVALEPIQAVPMRVPNASDSAPQPPASLRTPDKLKPRAATPSASASSVATSSSTTAPDTIAQDTTASDRAVPEPSERPSDAATPSDATLPSTSSNPPADASNATPPASSAATASMAGATPAALPARNSVQGWAVQAGAFKNASNATNLRDRLLKAGFAARVETGADGVNRVLVGAYVNANAAKAISATVAAALK